LDITPEPIGILTLEFNEEGIDTLLVLEILVLFLEVNATDSDDGL
jgi:hypothetical protein